MDELFQMLALSALKIHSKPIGILNINNYYDSLFLWFQSALKDGFIAQHVLDACVLGPDVEVLLDELQSRQTAARIVAISYVSGACTTNSSLLLEE